MRLSLSAFAAAFAMAALLSACGGGGSSSAADPNPTSPPPGTGGTAYLKGQFIDAPVAGLTYSVNGRTGTTDTSGNFEYDTAGQVVTFSVGGVVIGTATAAPAIHVYDLNASVQGVLEDRNVRVAQFLQSMDAERGRGTVIRIDAQALAKAPTLGLSFDGAQDEFDANLRAYLAALGLQDRFVGKAAAKAGADALLVNALSRCPLTTPASPDASSTPYRIQTGSLSCLDMARINYYNTRVRPFIEDSVNQATEGRTLVEEIWSEKAAQTALDANPVLAALSAADAQIAAVDAASKEKAFDVVANLSRVFAYSAKAMSELLTVMKPTDGSTASEAAAARAWLETIDKVMDTLSNGLECKAYLAKGVDADPAACLKTVTDAITAYNKSLDVPLLDVNKVADDKALRAQLTLLASEVSAATGTLKLVNSLGGDPDKTVRAAFGLASSLTKVTRDAITFSYVNRGEKVPDTGFVAVANGVLANVVTPFTNVAKNCYGKLSGTAVYTCASSQAQEVGKVAVKASFALVGSVTAVRSAGALNDTIVGKALLEELLWAGSGNIDAVYTKYGVMRESGTRLVERLSLYRLIEAVGLKKAGFNGVITYANLPSLLWAATWEGRNSFNKVAVKDFLQTYLTMIVTQTEPDFDSPAFDLSATANQQGRINVTVSVDPAKAGIVAGQLVCSAAGALNFAPTSPWEGVVNGKTTTQFSLDFDSNGRKALTCALYTSGNASAARFVASKALFLPAPFAEPLFLGFGVTPDRPRVGQKMTLRVVGHNLLHSGWKFSSLPPCEVASVTPTEATDQELLFSCVPTRIANMSYVGVLDRLGQPLPGVGQTLQVFCVDGTEPIGGACAYSPPTLFRDQFDGNALDPIRWPTVQNLTAPVSVGGSQVVLGPVTLGNFAAIYAIDMTVPRPNATVTVRIRQPNDKSVGQINLSTTQGRVTLSLYRDSSQSCNQWSVLTVGSLRSDGVYADPYACGGISGNQASEVLGPAGDQFYNVQFRLDGRQLTVTSVDDAGQSMRTANVTLGEAYTGGYLGLAVSATLDQVIVDRVEVSYQP